jgi:hypothetical protein
MYIYSGRLIIYILLIKLSQPPLHCIAFLPTPFSIQIGDYCQGKMREERISIKRGKTREELKLESGEGTI